MITLYPAIMFIAALYASVGHGGASGYLAIMSLYGFLPQTCAPSALLLNLLVSAAAFLAYRRAGHFHFSLFWPFALTSIPLAFVGAKIAIAPAIYSAILALALAWAGIRLLSSASDATRALQGHAPLALTTALGCGAGIGLVSGMVGIGGGIFLSPLMIFKRWADAKNTAAVSALFIWVNSAAALAGHASAKGADALALWPLAIAALIGGSVGSWLGAERLQSPALKKLLGIVLLIAAIKSAGKASTWL